MNRVILATAGLVAGVSTYFSMNAQNRVQKAERLFQSAQSDLETVTQERDALRVDLRSTELKAQTYQRILHTRKGTVSKVILMLQGMDENSKENTKTATSA